MKRVSIIQFGSPRSRSYEKSELADYTVRFRVTGRVPEVFDAATGSICDAADWRVTATNTEVKLPLGNNQSFDFGEKSEGHRADLLSVHSSLWSKRKP